jgi:hypothetical protein
MAKRIEVSLKVQFYGLVIEAEIEGDYEDGSFDPTSLYFRSIRDRDDKDISASISMTAPLATDFYCDHADEIDQLVAAEIAGEAEYQREMLDDMRIDAEEAA